MTKGKGESAAVPPKPKQGGGKSPKSPMSPKSPKSPKFPDGEAKRPDEDSKMISRKLEVQHALACAVENLVHELRAFRGEVFYTGTNNNDDEDDEDEEEDR